MIVSCSGVFPTQSGNRAKLRSVVIHTEPVSIDSAASHAFRDKLCPRSRAYPHLDEQFPNPFG